MTKEQLEKEKYICNFNEVTISDLFIKMTNGMRVVTLKRGDYLPTEILSSDDIKKSRLYGCLKRLIELGYIIVENPATEIGSIRKPVEVKFSAPSRGINEVEAGIVKASDLTNPISTAAQPIGMDPFPKDKALPVHEIISVKDSRTVNTFAITEKSIRNIPSYSNFSKLRYFQKLKAIKDMNDRELLHLIVEKDSYPQLIHNAQLRLKEISNGA